MRKLPSLVFQDTTFWVFCYHMGCSFSAFFVYSSFLWLLRLEWLRTHYFVIFFFFLFTLYLHDLIQSHDYKCYLYIYSSWNYFSPSLFPKFQTYNAISYFFTLISNTGSTWLKANLLMSSFNFPKHNILCSEVSDNSLLPCVQVKNK